MKMKWHGSVRMIMTQTKNNISQGVKKLKIILEIPQLIKDDYIDDKFNDFFGRVLADMSSNGKSSDNNLCGRYEKEIAENLQTAFAKARLMRTNGNAKNANKTHKSAERQ